MERTKENGYGLLADPKACPHPDDARVAPNIGYGRVLIICKRCGAFHVAGYEPRPARAPRDVGTAAIPRGG